MIPVQHDNRVVVGVGGQYPLANDLVVEDGGDHDADRRRGCGFPPLLQHDIGHGLGDADRDHGVGRDVAHVEQQHGVFGSDFFLLDNVFVPARVLGKMKIRMPM